MELTNRHCLECSVALGEPVTLENCSSLTHVPTSMPQGKDLSYDMSPEQMEWLTAQGIVIKDED
jgi:hypothetical protein